MCGFIYKKKNILEIYFSYHIQAMLHCAISRKEGIYRRKKRILTFDPYSLEMHTQLELKKRQVYSDLGRYKF